MSYNNLIEDGNLFGCSPYVFGGRNAINLAAALGSNAVLFALRNISNEEIIVDQVGYGLAHTGAALGTAQALSLALFKVDDFASSAASGVAVVATKKKSLSADIAAADYDCRVATTGALTSAPSTTSWGLIDMVYGEPNVLPVVNGIWKPRDRVPLTLQQNQGIVVAVTLPVTIAAGSVYTTVEARRA